MKMFLNNKDVLALAATLANEIGRTSSVGSRIKIYPVPRGGIPAAYALLTHTSSFEIVNNVEDCHVIVDDIIDSGDTRERYKKYNKRFFALINKQTHCCPYKNKWVVFPWEQKEDEQDEGIEQNILRILQYVEPGNEGVLREGLLETPKRVAKAWEEWTKGYGMDAGEILKVFSDGATDYDQMVMVKDIPLYSKCEHHLADIFGTATIAYIPNPDDPKIVGLSKLSRLVDMYAKRLQVQERLTTNIADSLVEHLNAKGVGVIIKARHMCMESRGICQQGHHTVTSALRGVIKDKRDPRNEFMLLATCN